MPEGHTIHRAARRQRERLVGPEVTAWSPQGRFSDGAAALSGHALTDIEAVGKHLFYLWEHGPILHVHLGLFGRFRLHRTDPPEPTDGTRLALAADGVTCYLSGPNTCELIDATRKREIVDQLGPDPLRDGADAADEIAAALPRRRIPIGQALLDQGVIAGIGNVYRAELCFRAGIHPFRPAREVSAAEVAALWKDARSQLRAGERSGRLITVDPDDVGADRRSRIPRGEGRYVYQRAGEPCRRCGTAITESELAGRRVWWCPSCQPG